MSYSNRYFELRKEKNLEKAHQEDWALFFLETSISLQKYFTLEDTLHVDEFNGKSIKTLGFKKKADPQNLRETICSSFFMLFEDEGICKLEKTN